jgi:UDP-N-acetylglucosamine 2-epimerase (non-hydrolysing)
VISVLGTRPEIVKFSPLLPLLDEACDHVLIHTGQHYDPLMDSTFFSDLQLRDPDRNLRIGSMSPAEQIGAMVARLGKEFARLEPCTVLVLGDTNSVLAGALAAIKCGARVGHIEAGCRSFLREAPEEQNRVLVDHVSHILFAPDEAAKRNLIREGLGNAHITGSSGLEAAGRVLRSAELTGSVKLRLREPFALATLHRAENTSSAAALRSRLRLLEAAAARLPVLFPLHPRTRALLKRWKIRLPKGITGVAPFGYLEFMAHLRQAECVLTDSGGVQEEAALAGTPCLILREETEWMSYVKEKRNFLVGGSLPRLQRALDSIASARKKAVESPVRAPKASARILSKLKSGGFFG